MPKILAIQRAKELFKADYANVQPHSGSSANAAAFLAMLEPNDTILGMSLDQGGHLTHGAKVNFSGKNYTAYQYGLHPETHDIDYDQVRDLAKEHNPKMIIAGFSAFSGTIMIGRFLETLQMKWVHIFLLIWLMYLGLWLQDYILHQFHMLMWSHRQLIKHSEAQDQELLLPNQMKHLKRN